VLQAAAEAKAGGSGRFCMGAAWREPKDRDMDKLCSMVAGVKAMGLETCMTLGMLSDEQAERLAEAGLDYYNHNLDSSPEYYAEVITTRTYQERLDTLARVRASGMSVCCGGIVGMGETREDRVGFLHALATLPEHPESVPINALVPIKGTVLGDMLADTPLGRIDDIEFVRTVAVARILMPRSMVRLSAGRESMSEACQALCFMAGANSIFTGDKLLTTGNAGGGRRCAAVRETGIGADDRRRAGAGRGGMTNYGHRPCGRVGRADVQEDPDRQSRRDCLPGHPHRQAHGHQDGRRLFGCRRPRAAREDGRRSGAAWARRRRARVISRRS
jgi:biotin synthase